MASRRTIRVNEVTFANHMQEFSRFYDKHKNLCDRISGISERIYQDGEGHKSLRIEKHNFYNAIKCINSFVLDNIHYIKGKDKLIIKDNLRKLELKYISDKDYKSYSDRFQENQLNVEEKIYFEKLYFNYVIECFELSYEISKVLQKSLMIHTGDIKKLIGYWDTTGFFVNLFRYRDEVSNDIALFKFKNTIDHFKKILGYYYTYKLFLTNKDILDIDKINNNIYTIFMSDEFQSLILASRKLDKKSKNDLISTQTREKIIAYSYLVQLVFGKIYEITNKALSEKNILPKPKEKIYIDKTGI